MRLYGARQVPVVEVGLRSTDVTARTVFSVQADNVEPLQSLPLAFISCDSFQSRRIGIKIYIDNCLIALESSITSHYTRLQRSRGSASHNTTSNLSQIL